MTTARDHIRQALYWAEGAEGGNGDAQWAGVHALVAIAMTLVDMADMDADTRTQPRIDPAEYWHGRTDITTTGDPDRIPT